jgi:hypothetical protein
LPPLPVCPKLLGALDIRRLGTLIPAAKQHHQNLAMPTEISPVAGANMKPQFQNASADGLTVA